MCSCWHLCRKFPVLGRSQPGSTLQVAQGTLFVFSNMGLTFASDRLRSAVQGESSGKNSRGLPKSCRLVSWASARRSSTGVASRLFSKLISRSSLQLRSCTAGHGQISIVYHVVGPILVVTFVFPKNCRAQVQAQRPCLGGFESLLETLQCVRLP